MNRQTQSYRRFDSIVLLFVTLALTSMLVGGCASRSKYSKMERSQVERMAVRQSAGMGTALGAIAGAAAGYYLGNESPSAAIAGAIGGGYVGNRLGTAQGNKRVAQTRISRSEKQRMEALLQDARKSNAALASYNQNLESQIADLRRRPARSSIQRTYTEAVKKSSVTKSEISQLRNYAESLPPSEQDSVLTAAANLQEENDATVAMISELSQMERVAY